MTFVRAAPWGGDSSQCPSSPSGPRDSQGRAEEEGPWPAPRQPRIPPWAEGDEAESDSPLCVLPRACAAGQGPGRLVSERRRACASRCELWGGGLTEGLVTHGPALREGVLSGLRQELGVGEGAVRTFSAHTLLPDSQPPAPAGTRVQKPGAPAPSPCGGRCPPAWRGDTTPPGACGQDRMAELRPGAQPTPVSWRTVPGRGLCVSSPRGRRRMRPAAPRGPSRTAQVRGSHATRAFFF